MYLSNARSTSVRQNNGPDILENCCYFVALHRCSNLFRSGSTEEGNLKPVQNGPQFKIARTLDDSPAARACRAKSATWV